MKNLLLKFWQWRLEVADRKYSAAVTDFQNGYREYGAITEASIRYAGIREIILKLERKL